MEVESESEDDDNDDMIVRDYSKEPAFEKNIGHIDISHNGINNKRLRKNTGLLIIHTYLK